MLAELINKRSTGSVSLYSDRSNICVIPENVVPEWEERKNGSKKILENMIAENFPKLIKDIDPQNWR